MSCKRLLSTVAIIGALVVLGGCSSSANSKKASTRVSSSSVKSSQSSSSTSTKQSKTTNPSTSKKSAPQSNFLSGQTYITAESFSHGSQITFNADGTFFQTSRDADMSSGHPEVGITGLGGTYSYSNNVLTLHYTEHSSRYVQSANQKDHEYYDTESGDDVYNFRKTYQLKVNENNQSITGDTTTKMYSDDDDGTLSNFMLHVGTAAVPTVSEKATNVAAFEAEEVKAPIPDVDQDSSSDDSESSDTNDDDSDSTDTNDDDSDTTDSNDDDDDSNQDDSNDSSWDGNLYDSNDDNDTDN